MGRGGYYGIAPWQYERLQANKYANNYAYISKWLNALLVASSTDELYIQVNENFDLLPILEEVGIVRLKLILDKRFFMSEAILQALNTWIYKISHEGTSKTVGENM